MVLAMISGCGIHRSCILFQVSLALGLLRVLTSSNSMAHYMLNLTVYPFAIKSLFFNVAFVFLALLKLMVKQQTPV